MDDALLWHRLQFGFTVTYHYLFPQLTMGLAWILVYWKWRHLRTGDERYGNVVRFWESIFGINFAAHRDRTNIGCDPGVERAGLAMR
jgi:cytochrome d ubiquinol oxidase subunit I